MLGIPLGLLYANAGEWFIHKYVLHGPEAKKPGGAWSFHWLDHHRLVRLKDFLDPAYAKPLTEWNPQSKEVAALVAAGLVHLPLFPVAPFFTGTVLYSMVNYYRVHKRSHLDPAWAREHLPWHYDHHMGPDQDKNWCVTRPWFDVVMGTRVPYVGTERDRRDQEILARKQARKAAAGASPAEAPVHAEVPVTAEAPVTLGAAKAA